MGEQPPAPTFGGHGGGGEDVGWHHEGCHGGHQGRVEVGEDQEKTVMEKQGKLMTKMMKRRRNLHPTRKSYAIRTGKRSAEKFTDCLKIWLPRMSRGTEGKWFLQEDMEREKRYLQN